MTWADMIRVGGVAACSDPMDVAKTSANSALKRGFFIRCNTKPEQTLNLTIPCLLFARFAFSVLRYLYTFRQKLPLRRSGVDYRAFHQIEESVAGRQSWEKSMRGTIRKDWSGFAKRGKAATRTVCKLMLCEEQGGLQLRRGSSTDK